MNRILFVAVTSSLLLSACASSTFKARQEQRERLATSSGMFCEFVSGDVHPDVDVELSMTMARRCDSNRPFTITNYKNSSDQQGLVYCCAVVGSRASLTSQSRPAVKAKPAPAPVVKEESNEEVEPANPAAE